MDSSVRFLFMTVIIDNTKGHVINKLPLDDNWLMRGSDFTFHAQDCP